MDNGVEEVVQGVQSSDSSVLVESVVATRTSKFCFVRIEGHKTMIKATVVG